MATITLRATKGSPLTNTEVDNNFSNLNTDIGTRLLASSYTASDVISKLLTVDGTGSGLDADLLDGLNTSSGLPVSVDKSSVVTRDSSGNFTGSTITATVFSGKFSGEAAITSGAITTLTTALSIPNGGTGATTQAGAQTALGLAIGTDVQAYNPNLAALAGLTTVADRVPYFTAANTAALATFTATGRTIVSATSTLDARSKLGLAIGTDVQAYDADLSAVAGLSTNGIIVRTGAGTASTRTLVAGTDITITNADGVSGDITINSTAAPIAGTGVTVTGKTVSIGQAVATTSAVTFASVSAGTVTATSDISLKANVKTIDNALSKVLSLRGVEYDRIDTSNHEIGVIAQEIEKYVPEVVYENDGIKSVAYGNLVGILIEAIKDLNKEIEQLKQKG